MAAKIKARGRRRAYGIGGGDENYRSRTDLLSVVYVKRSRSAHRGRINSAVNTRAKGDSPNTLTRFTAATQPISRPSKRCAAAPGIIYLFDRMGVPVFAHKEGLLGADSAARFIDGVCGRCWTA